MTYRVLLVLEDFVKDRFVVKPVVEAIFANLDAQARVEIYPVKMGGWMKALDKNELTRIATVEKSSNLIIVACDRDCNRNNVIEKAQAREAELAGRLLVCLAIEEIETWLMWLHKDDDEMSASWGDIRAHCDPKEAYAEPFLKAKGWTGGPDDGRKSAMKALAQRSRGLIESCEEIAGLRQKIKDMLAAGRP